MPYLAMTAAEFQHCRELPEKIAWMACHFSPYGTGLTNLPDALPPGALLILNDRTPVAGHDPDLILHQLSSTVDRLQCHGVLLDLQRPNCPETTAIVKKLLQLPCPVIVSEPYAVDRNCPVFLPPVPLNRTIEEYIFPWRGREIWLEVALDVMRITVTEQGSAVSPLPALPVSPIPHMDTELFCHYGISISDEKAEFTLQRTKQDLKDLLAAAKSHGINHSVGLYQELGQK